MSLAKQTCFNWRSFASHCFDRANIGHRIRVPVFISVNVWSGLFFSKLLLNILPLNTNLVILNFNFFSNVSYSVRKPCGNSTTFWFPSPDCRPFEFPTSKVFRSGFSSSNCSELKFLAGSIESKKDFSYSKNVFNACCSSTFSAFLMSCFMYHSSVL